MITSLQINFNFPGQAWKIQELTGFQLRIARGRCQVSRPWLSRDTSPEGRVFTPRKALMMLNFMEVSRN